MEQQNKPDKYPTDPTGPKEPAGGPPLGGPVGAMADPASISFLKLAMTGMSAELAQLSWDGDMVWSFKNWPKFNGLIDGAAMHHDFEREGNPVGYYAPGQDFKEKGKTLILAHAIVSDPKICQTVPFDYDIIYEVDWDGRLTGFEWHSRDHINELGLDKSARDFILNPKAYDAAGWQVFDFTHANTVSLLGKNKWYSDSKDERFNPNNMMMSFRNLGCLIIIDRNTGRVIWRVGPDYENPEFAGLGGPIIGQHMTHIIPKGLPGAGNVLLFDNGSGSGYGGTKGYAKFTRGYSRILEFNPVNLKMVWEYTNKDFYSPVISGVQRLPNGNTLICEGVGARIFEVTATKEKIWEIKAGTVSINNPGACQGYTLMSSSMMHTILVDMKGKIVKSWDLMNFPAKMLPDGSIIGGVAKAGAPLRGAAADGALPPGVMPGGPPLGGGQCYRAYRVPPEWVPGNPAGYSEWAKLP